MIGKSPRRSSVVIGGNWDRWVNGLSVDAVNGFVDIAKSGTLLIDSETRRKREDDKLVYSEEARRYEDLI